MAQLQSTGITGSLTVTGNITAQSLVVQTITSSVSYITGSTIFGSSLSNTHKFTGSLFQTGSLATFAGSVGIGTISPTNTLHVVGTGIVNIVQSSNTVSYTQYYNSSTGTNSTNDGLTVGVNGTDALIFQREAANLIFGTSDTERMRILSGGNVGIGTTSPSSLLHVSKAGNSAGGTILMGVANNSTDKWSYLVSTQYNSSTHPQGFSLIGGFTSATSNVVVIGGSIYEANPATEITFWTHTAVSHSLGGSERMRITSAGSVGIGTTSPIALLQVAGAAQFGDVTSMASFTDAPIRIRTTSQKSITMVYTAVRNWNLGINSSGTFLINDGDAPADRLAINTSGNVGIGTTAPIAKLVVTGNGTGQGLIGDLFGSGNYTGISLNGSNSAANYNFLSSPTDNALYINRPSGLAIKFREANGSDQLTIATGGNVGIGTTSPSFTLDVAGNIGINGRLFAFNSATYTQITDPAGGIKLYLGASGDPGNYYDNTSHNFRSIGGSTVYTTINSTGVGIGTTSPSQKLSVSSADNTRISVTDTGESITSHWGVNSGQVFFTAETNHPIAFYTNGSIKMYIEAAGNVGIGTTAPVSKLQVIAADGYSSFWSNNASNYTFISIGRTSSELEFGVAAGANQFFTGTVAGDAAIKVPPNKGSLFIGATSGAPAMVISQSNSIGIGTTSPTLAKLQVNGNVWATSYTGSFSGSISAPGSNTNVIYNSSGVLAGSNSFVFNGTNVGIGTASPLNKLEVNAGGTVGYSGNDIVFRNSNGQSALYHDPGGYVYWYSTQAITFYPGQSRSVTFSTGGNVGIGSTSPGYKLDVSGDINFSSTVKFGGVNVIHNTSTDVYINGRVLYSNSTLNDGMYIGYNSTGGTSAHIRFFANGTNERMRIDAANGSVGIGTTSPSYKLHVVGSIYTSTNLTSAGSITIGMSPAPFWNAKFTDYSDGSGVYIGSVQAGGYKYIAGESYYNNSSYWYSDKTTSTAIGLGDGILRFYTDSGLTANTNFIPSERMRITAGGNVGIGTTSPSSKLAVSGSIQAYLADNQGTVSIAVGEGSTGASSNSIVLESNTTSNTTLIYNNGTSTNLYIASTGTNADILLSSRRDIYFNVNNAGNAFSGTTAMYINTNGSVGIGTTSPAHPLDVIGVGRFSGGIRTTGANGYQDTDGTRTVALYANYTGGTPGVGTLSNHDFAFYTNGTNERMRILAGGNVGIGTTNPGGKFDIQTNSSGDVLHRFWNINTAGTGTSAIRIANSGNNNNGSRIEFTDNAYYVATIAGDRTQGLTFRTDATGGSPTGTSIRMIILPGGNVGIGTTAPGYKLDVVENVNSFAASVTNTNTNGSAGGLRIIKSNGGQAALYIDNTGGYGNAATILGGNVGIGTTSAAVALDVRGVIQGQTYILPDTGGTAQWVKVGTLTIPQQGYTAHIRAYIHSGFNALNDQDFYVDIFFKTSNASSVDGNGFAGNSWYYANGFSGTNVTPKWVGNAAGVSATAYDLYLYLPNYTNRSQYIVEIVQGATWANLGTTGQVDPGAGSSTVCVSSPGFNFTVGNVGVGTTSPAYKLDVAGTGRFTSTLIANSSVQSITLGSDGTYGGTYPMIGFTGTTNGTHRIFAGTADDMYFAAATSRGFQWRPNGGTSSTMILTSGGNVGIGTTSPGNTLEIAGTSGTTQFKVRSNDGTAANNSGLLVYNAASATAASRVIEVILDPNGANATGVDYTVLRMYGSGNSDLINFYSGATLSLGADGASIMYLKGSNVGIGTTSPSSLLHVSKAGNSAGGTILMGVANNSTDKWSYLVSTQYNSSTHPQGFSLIGGFTSATSNVVVIGGSIYEANPATEITFWTHTAVSHSLGGSERMRITSAGSVGIGTTSPSYLLDVAGNGSFSGNGSNNYVYFRGNAGSGGSTNPGYVQGFNLSWNRSNGQGESLITYTNQGGGSNVRLGIAYWNNSSVSEQLTIASSGNVGIGSATPAYKLDVIGSIASNTGTNEAQVYVRNSTSSIYLFNSYAGNSFGLYDGTAGQMRMLYDRASNYWALYTGASEKLRLDANGNVGIGTTSPQAKVHIGPLNGDTTPHLYLASGNNSYGWRIDTQDSGAGVVPLRIWRRTGGSDTQIITANNADGNVGIGTTSPAQKLSVNGAIESLTDTSTEGGQFIMRAQSGYSYRYSWDNRIDTVRLIREDDSTSANGTSLITVLSNGNVGIGSTSPAYKLDVSGSIRATGDVIAYSDARVKDNVETITDALTKVTSLRGVSYTRKDNEDKSRKVGVIAQEVLEVLPEVVQQDNDGNYSVAYGNMVGVLIEAIKEQQRQIDELKYLLSQKQT